MAGSEIGLTNSGFRACRTTQGTLVVGAKSAPFRRTQGVFVNSRLVAIIGVALAIWMSAGRWAFGIGGWLTYWYVPAIGLTYAALQIWLAARIRITRSLGKRNRSSVTLMLVLSWLCAIAFGFTVPDSTPDGLVSILGLLTNSSFSTEMSIALCNPFGIIAFALVGGAIGFAYADIREPINEDDLDDEFGTPVMKHPLA